MTDRELLEAAAKAAGFHFHGHRIGREYETCYVSTTGDTDDWFVWSPLTDDGDALRLAAALNIDIEMGLCYCETTWVDMVKSETHRFLEDWGAGPTLFDIRMNHVRRAIVRAAAEVGKETP